MEETPAHIQAQAVAKPKRDRRLLYATIPLLALMIYLAYGVLTQYNCGTGNQEYHSTDMVHTFYCFKAIPPCKLTIQDTYIQKNHILQNTCGTDALALSLKQKYDVPYYT